MASIGYVHDNPTPSANDNSAIAFLEGAGHTVTEINETASPPAAGTYDLIIISESGSSSSVAPYDTYADPVMVWETSWNSLRLSSAGASSSGSTTQVDLVGHASTTGLPDPLTYLSSAASMYGVASSSLPSGVEIVGRHPSTTTHCFCIVADAGATLTSGTAPARRAAMGLLDSRVGALTADGQDLILALVDWLVGGGGGSGGTGTAAGGYDFSGTAVGDNGEGANLPALVGAADSQVEQESHSYNPVYEDTNGNLYTITESILSANNQPRAMKSTDGGETWSEMDAANRPGTDTGSIGDLESGWITQEPGYLTFTWARSYPAYSRFRTSDHPTNPDTWEDNDREQIGSGSGTPQFMSHTSPTDQTYQWMFWANGSDISYNSRPLGADTTESSTLTLQASAGAPMAWLDSNNVSWIVYKASSQLHYKTLTSGGTLSSSTRIDTNGVNAVAIPHCRPVPYESGVDEVVTVVFANGSGQLRAVDIVNGTPGSEQTITNNAVTLNPGTTGNDGAVLSADVDGDTMHVFWSDSSTGDLLHSERPYGGSWTTPDTVVTGLSTGVWWLYAKTIEHLNGSRVVGLRYSDGFDTVDETNAIYYTEFALAASEPPSEGTASGSYSFAGTAVGNTPPHSGTAAGSYAFSGTATGTNKPPVPTGLTATPVSGSQIDLSWDAVSGVSGYDIERDGVVIVFNHASTSYSDTGLTPLTSYDYRVRSVN